MSGFKLNLKGSKGAGTPSPKIGFSLKKNIPKKPINKTVTLANSDSEDDDDEKIVSIDSFDQRKGGARNGNISVSAEPKKEVLVIKIPDSKQRRTEKSATDQDVNESISDSKDQILTEDQIIRQSLISGDLIPSSEGLTIKRPQSVDNDIEDQEDDEDQYNKVPVEQFGAALLRGMGWKPNKKVKPNPNLDNVEKRKRGELLGIGAQKVENELMLDLMGKRGDSIGVPLVKRDKKSGELIKQ